MVAAGLIVYALVAAGLLRQEAREKRDGWSTAQIWARDKTLRDAVFLTPTQPGGFRVWSERSVVGGRERCIPNPDRC